MKRMLTVGLLVPVLAGCQLGRDVNPAVGPEELPTAVVQFPDLPVPHAMELRSSVNQSWSWQRSAFRNAQLYYEGRVVLEDLRSFLRERLPTHGWEVLQEERPTQERVVQRWLQNAPTGVQYLLDAELLAAGATSELRYHLWTRRAWSTAGAAPAEATK